MNAGEVDQCGRRHGPQIHLRVCAGFATSRVRPAQLAVRRIKSSRLSSRIPQRGVARILQVWLHSTRADASLTVNEERPGIGRNTITEVAQSFHDRVSRSVRRDAWLGAPGLISRGSSRFIPMTQYHGHFRNRNKRLSMQGYGRFRFPRSPKSGSYEHYCRSTIAPSPKRTSAP